MPLKVVVHHLPTERKAGIADDNMVELEVEDG